MAFDFVAGRKLDFDMFVVNLEFIFSSARDVATLDLPIDNYSRWDRMGRSLTILRIVTILKQYKHSHGNVIEDTNKLLNRLFFSL